jgi:hypothetical protein
MGFLRKVGRKVSKKLNKIFGQKLGTIVGMVGMYFMMGALAKGLTGFAKSAFGVSKSTSDAVALTSKVSDAAQATLDAKSTADAAAIATTAAEKTVSATAASTGASVETMITEATSNSDKFNSWVGGQESLLNQGKLPSTVSPSLTDTVINSVSNPEVLKQTAAEVSANVNISAPKIDFTEISKQSIEGSSKNILQSSLETGKTASETSRLQAFAADPIGSTTDFIKTKASETGEYLTGDFVPDTVQAGASGALMNAFNPPEEEVFQSKGVQYMPGLEESHMREIGPQLAASNLGHIRTFADLANQTVYGTGTTNYLQEIYQPLPTPTPIRVG